MPSRAAALILDAFLDYNERFADITRRAKRHFEQRDWHAAQVDAVARIDLYDVCVGETLERLERLLDDRVRSRPLWASMRNEYALQIEPLIDKELTKTFFNTLSRRFFRTRGVDAEIEFIALGIEPTAGIVEPVALNRYGGETDLADTCAGVLGDYAFANGYADPARCARAIAHEIAERTIEDGVPLLGIELLRTVFYRERRAYLVGRILDGDDGIPLVIALMSTPQGVRADAVLTNLNQVSLLFGYARSYFHADLPTIGNTVLFLRR